MVSLLDANYVFALLEDYMLLCNSCTTMCSLWPVN